MFSVPIGQRRPKPQDDRVGTRSLTPTAPILSTVTSFGPKPFFPSFPSSGRGPNVPSSLFRSTVPVG